MITDIQITHGRIDFNIKNMGIANGLRRAIMNDIEAFAPSHIVMRENMTCQTDEYIAHRIAMIPFHLKGNSSGFLTLNVRDRSAFTSDLVGDDFEVATTTIPIIKMIKGQALHFDVYFERGSGKDHAKFSHISRVSYDNKNSHVNMGFETITTRPAIQHLRCAIEAMEKNLHRVVYLIESEPEKLLVSQ